MTVQVVLVHGIRTSATMWRSQLAYLAARGNPVTAVDLPGHGSRMSATFTLDAALATIDSAVADAASRGPVLLVGHSMGGLVCIEYLGRRPHPGVAAFVGAGCTAFPRGVGLAAYRALAKGFDSLPDRGLALTEFVLARTLPEETRGDYAAGGYALDTQDRALAALADLDLTAALPALTMPVWFVNGQYDQLRLNERTFLRLVPHAELVVVPQTTHLVTAMRPRVFNAALNLAITTIEQTC